MNGMFVNGRVDIHCDSTTCADDVDKGKDVDYEVEEEEDKDDKIGITVKTCICFN